MRCTRTRSPTVSKPLVWPCSGRSATMYLRVSIVVFMSLLASSAAFVPRSSMLAAVPPEASAAAGDVVRAVTVAPRVDNTATLSPIEQFYAYFIEGKCDEMYAMLTPDFIYWSTNEIPNSPPLQINATTIHTICFGQNGKNSHSPPFNTAVFGSWSVAHFNSVAYFPSLVDGSTNCTFPQNSMAEAEVDASGKIKVLRQVVPAAKLWFNAANLCIKSTPFPKPDPSPTADRTAFINDYINLYYSGACDELAQYQASNFSALVGLESQPLDATQLNSYCKNAFANAATWHTPDYIYNDGPDDTFVVGPMAYTVTDPTTQKPCTVYFEMVSHFHSFVDPTSNSVKVDFSGFGFDEAAASAALMSQCHTKVM